MGHGATPHPLPRGVLVTLLRPMDLLRASHRFATRVRSAQRLLSLPVGACHATSSTDTRQVVPTFSAIFNRSCEDLHMWVTRTQQPGRDLVFVASHLLHAFEAAM